jgi:peptidoglycan/xylan/chitin deacetylase (PgdA/CDA1 family)
LHKISYTVAPKQADAHPETLDCPTICDDLIVIVPLATGIATSGAGMLAHAVRGRSARFFGPSVWRGDAGRRAIAITFDDGPSESTPLLIDTLLEYSAPATFFQCGANVRRLPEVAREVQAGGHEIGNHSDSHPLSCFRTASFIQDDFARAQQTIQDTLGVAPSLMRAPFGVRWFGYRSMQEKLGLLGVMWTVIGLDWKLPAQAICDRVLRTARNGSIVCLHDGRTCSANPDVSNTVEAVKRLLPALLEQGYHFETVSQILCPLA